MSGSTFVGLRNRTVLIRDYLRLFETRSIDTVGGTTAFDME